MISTGRPPYEMAAEHGIIQQEQNWKKFLLRGRCNALNTLADIIATADLMTYRTVGVKVGVASSSANDTNTAGTGARTVRLTMVSDAYLEVVETLALNGTAKVETTAANIIAINDMQVMTVGSGGVSAGNIDAGNTADAFTGGSITTAANFMHTIIAGKNKGEFAGWTVLAKSHVFVKSILGTAYDATTTVKYATLDLCYLETDASVWQYFPLIQTSSATGARSYGGKEGKRPLYFPPKSAFRIRGICSAAAIVTAEVEGLLITQF